MTTKTSADSGAARVDKKKHKKKKRERGEKDTVDEIMICKRKLEDTKPGDSAQNDEKPKKKASVATDKRQDNALVTSGLRKELNFPHRYILAPMVGASELAFRMLCRRYGTELAYTPMMSAQKFATDKAYREEEFQTCAEDRPLVCHFCANDPRDFAAAAKAAEPYCDAIDLNLGCPQRTAYLGHFGSYLLDTKDRELVCSIVRAGAQAVQLPIVCKIRLLDTLEDTIQLCKELRDAGCSLIAVHARYRASWERKSPGARDGPALLDYVAKIKKAITDIPIIANGNTITYDDVDKNLRSTGADGIMSAEGILDNPALYLPRLGNVENADNQQSEPTADSSEESAKKIEKLKKKMRKIARIESTVAAKGVESLDEEDKRRLEKKGLLEKSLQELNNSRGKQNDSLEALYTKSENKLKLAEEYLDLATTYPVKMRSVIFHTRRMIKSLLEKYQLLEECLAADSIDDVRSILQKVGNYEKNPQSFVFDVKKAKQEKEALERKRAEEGKRKAYEARMKRKAKREGKQDLEFYLQIGAELPSKENVAKLKKTPRPEALEIWKQKHSQHCISFHLDKDGCRRGRACAFLHVDVLGSNTFEEKDEVAG